MTENEAIEVGKSLYENITLKGNNIIPVAKYIEFVRMAIQALEENQELHAIGTIEEFKDLKEKNKPNKVIMDCAVCGNCYTDVSDWNINYCPNCGQRVN